VIAWSTLFRKPGTPFNASERNPEVLFFAICATAWVARATFVAVGLMLAAAVLLVWACVGERRRLMERRLSSQLALVLSCMSNGY
jgi:Flp pilus assembly protein TadB